MFFKPNEAFNILRAFLILNYENYKKPYNIPIRAANRRRKKVVNAARENERGKQCERENKAGYTANISCGRVGRGGNARFHTFRLVLTDGPTDRRTDGRTKPLIE